MDKNDSDVTTWSKIKEASGFYFVRIIVIIIAFYIGYMITKSYLVPDVYDNMCLTGTDNCLSMDIYQHENTFVAQEKISQIWFWFNGVRLYIYGQAPGSCQDSSYQPVNVFTIQKGADNVLGFTPYANECVSKLETVVDYYKNNLKSEPNTIYIKKYDTASYQTNLYEIIKAMIDNNVFQI